METKTVIYGLRTKHGLSQDELAEKVFVTRQAVSRWENGETVPLDDPILSREPNGEFNEDYCKWCYSEGRFAYQSKEELLDYLVEHMPAPEGLQNEEIRMQFDSLLSRLKHWKE